MNKLPRDEIIAIRLKEMKGREALDIAIAFLTPCTLVDCEVARIILRAMCDEIREEKHGDIIKANLSLV